MIEGLVEFRLSVEVEGVNSACILLVKYFNISRPD